MSTQHFTDLRAFERAFKRDTRAREGRVRNAVRKTARQTRNYVVREVPRAFAELAESLHVVDGAAGNSDVVADAPHAAAVENGSRPHTPPLAPLIAWVALRGVQGLSEYGRVKKNRTGYGVVKDPRREAARVVATSLANRLGRGKRHVYGAIGRTGQWRQRAASHLAKGNHAALADDPATVAVARAIQMAIKKRGTKPHHYMLSAVPQAQAFLDGFVTAALPDR